MNKLYLMLAGGIFLVACGKDTTQTPTPQFLDNIPDFAVVAVTPKPTVVADDDPRLPIEPRVEGQALYEANCANCHGINGEGQYPSDPYKLNEDGLAGAPPHDVTGHTWHHPDQQLIEIIFNGQNLPNFELMPSFKDKLTIDEMISILAHIKTWWGIEELQRQHDTTEAAMTKP